MDRRKFLAGAAMAGVVSATDVAAAQKKAGEANGRRVGRDAKPDWLIEPEQFVAKVTHIENGIVLENGLARRVFRVKPNAATVQIENLMTGETELRSVRPEAMLTINDYEIADC